MSYKKKPKTINPNEIDPSVYYYDEVYDEMKDVRTEDEPTSSKEVKQGSKYIQGLMETAEQRKVDNEIRKFKKYTRDRDEAETQGNLSNKDVFITSAYEKKLKEIEKLENDKRRRIESEKDNSMNFAKKLSPQTKVGPIIRSNGGHDEEEIETNRVNIFPKSEEPVSPVQRPSKRSLKTLEDRRVYLREILAKRTTGKVFDAAVVRYLERKAAKIT